MRSVIFNLMRSWLYERNLNGLVEEKDKKICNKYRKCNTYLNARVVGKSYVRFKILAES